MPIAAILFFFSLAGLIGMVFAKQRNLGRGKTATFAPLARFDVPLAFFLKRSSVAVREELFSFYQNSREMFQSTRHSFTAYLHQLLQSAERRVRIWRDFARERTIERGEASGFIKDVFEYKNHLKDKHDEPTP